MIAVPEEKDIVVATAAVSSTSVASSSSSSSGKSSPAVHHPNGSHSVSSCPPLHIPMPEKPRAMRKRHHAPVRASKTSRSRSGRKSKRKKTERLDLLAHIAIGSRRFGESRTTRPFKTRSVSCPAVKSVVAVKLEQTNPQLLHWIRHRVHTVLKDLQDMS